MSDIMVKYNYVFPNNLNVINEGKYPVGATFYNDSNEAIYQYTSNGITDVNGNSVLVDEYMPYNKSSCPTGYTKQTISNNSFLMIGSTSSSGGSEAISGASHSHTLPNTNIYNDGMSGTHYWAVGDSTGSSNLDYSYICYIVCLSNIRHSGLCE